MGSCFSTEDKDDVSTLFLAQVTRISIRLNLVFCNLQPSHARIGIDN